MPHDDSPGRQIDAIVGAALKALVESGADDEFIGSFAASHRMKIAQIMGLADAPAQPLDLETIVARAVAAALADAGVKKPRSWAKTERVNVAINGKRTSITLNKQLVAQLVEAKGRKTANDLIEDLANKAPMPPGRSKWISERVHALLLNPNDVPRPSTSRH